MIKEAIFHRADSHMSYLTDDGKVVIIIKAKKGDLAKAVLIYDDRYDRHPANAVVRVQLSFLMNDELYDYFGAKFECKYTRMCYYFSLIDHEDNHLYFYQDGFSQDYSWGRQRLFQFPYLHSIDTPHVPKWLKSSVMYQIFPDSFANGKNTIEEKPTSHTVDKGVIVESRFGGTLRGIIENISYLRDLGVNLLYLNPIFTANSYHKYDTVDYFKVDPCLGTDEDLKELVSKCHKNDIRIMLDIVFNQSSNKFFAFQDVFKNNENSQYADWYKIHEFPVHGGDNPNYETFGFYETMPKFNTDNKEVEDYLISIGRHWIKKFNIDGYRIDVANEVSHDFWRKFRYEMDMLKEDFALIGELWHDSHSFIAKDQFHSVQNFPLMYAIWEFFAFDSINAHQFVEKINRLAMVYPLDNTQAMMNFIDCHDVGRFLTMAKCQIERQKLAAVFLFTYIGMPSIYYGDEKAMEGNDINDSRRKMIWQDDGRSLAMHEFYKALVKIRREYLQLQTGSYRPLVTDVENNIFGYCRGDGEDTIICMFNNSPIHYSTSIATTNHCGIYIDLLTGKEYSTSKRELPLAMDPFTSLILKKN